MSLDTTATVVPARAAHVPTVASVLAQAFQDDPVFAWAIPDPARRRTQLPGVFTAWAEIFQPYEETYVTDDSAGAAMWAPDGAEPFAGEAGELFARRVTELLANDADRFLQIGEIFQQYEPAQPWMYLQVIGVLPTHQGRGLGSRLLAPVLQRCDEAGTPAYLEASSPHNRRLYERHGFRMIDEIVLPERGPAVWAMWREPGT